MGRLFLTLLYVSVLTSLSGACLFRDTSLCPARTPLIFGGHIQPEDPNNPLWENGRKIFVFQAPPQGHMVPRMGFGVRGPMGVIRIGRKSCTGSSEGSLVCPVTFNSNLPCRLHSKSSCTSDPLHISNITSTGFHAQWDHFDPIVRANAVISGYALKIRELGGEINEITTAEDVTFTDVRGLTPDTIYDLGLVPISSSTSTEFAPTKWQRILTLCGVPSSPVIFEGETTSREATINVQIPPTRNWQCSNITVHIQTEVGGEWVDVKELDPSDTEVTIDSLIPCSDYKYRVELSNYHETVYSDVLTVYTKGEGLTAVENINAISDVSQVGKLNVSWSPPDSPDTACSVSHYNIQYSLIKYKTCPYDEHSVYENVNVYDIEVTLENLEDYAEYIVSVTPMVSTVDQSGFIPGESITVTGSTATNNPTEAPSDILLTGVSQTSLKFSWKQPHTCHRENGVITSYSYILHNDDGVEVVSGSTEKTNVAIEGLEPNTKYHFKVNAVNSAGPGPFSEPVWEETRYRTPSCPGKSPLRVGGVLRKSRYSVGSPPWGTGQPIFILPHHMKNPFKRGGGITKVWFVQTRNCGGSSGSGPCQARTAESQVDVPSTCPIEDGQAESFQCDAVCPRFSESTEAFSTESPDLSSLFLSWRDWDVTVDRGIGPVTGYIIRYGKVGEAQTEIQKGLSLHHLFTNLTINTDFSFEVVGLKGTSDIGGSLCEGSPSFRFNHTTGCGKLDPVQDLTVTNDGELRTLYVSWTAPTDGLCLVSQYEVSFTLHKYKACPHYENSSYTQVKTYATEITLRVDKDFAEYNISVIPITMSLDNTGDLYGESTLVVGTTAENEPFSPPLHLHFIDETPLSIGIKWTKIACTRIQGNFTMYSYSLLQEDVYFNGTTQDDTVHIYGLIAYANFTFNVRAHTTAAPGPSQPHFYSTPESTPLSYNNMTVMDLLEITATTITLSWPTWDESVGMGEGTLDSYLLVYGEQGAEPTNVFTVGVDVTYRFENLAVDTEYYFRISVIGRGRGFGVIGPYSEKQTFRTRCGVPAKPTLTLTKDKVTPTSVAYHYEFLNEDDPWKCRTISIYFQMENGEGGWDNNQNVSTTDIDISHLLPCTDYRFRMKLENRHEVTFSDIMDVGTDVERLGQVRDLQVITQGEDGHLLVTWTPPENEGNCSISGYGLWVDLIGIESCDYNELLFKTSSRVNTTYTMLKDLEPYSKFFVSVKPLLNYGGDPLEWAGAFGTTKAVSPIGVVTPELMENAISERSLTFSWVESGLNCENQLGPNFGYECFIYELNTGSPVFQESKRVSENLCTFNNLKACGKYSCKVRPVNEGNEGEFSSAVYGSISPAALLSIRNITVTSFNNGDVKIRWLSPDNSSNLCPVAGFKLNYTLQRHQACPRCIDVEQPPLTTYGTSYMMKNLSAFTTYKVNIAVDIADTYTVGSGVVSTDRVFTTRFGFPTERPRVYHAPHLATSNSLEFRWRRPDCDKMNGIFKHYTIGGNSTTGETGIAGKLTRSYKLHHLQPCTKYSFTVKFVNIIGRGPMGVAFGTTKIGKPGRKFNLLLEPLSNGDLLVTWQESAENPCDVDVYIINIARSEISTCEKSDGLDNSDRVVDKNERNVTFTMSEDLLMGNTKYLVTLRGVNSIGEGDRDAAGTLTKVLAPSVSPEGVYSRTIRSTYMMLSCRKMDCLKTNGRIIGYHYQMTLDDVMVADTTTIKRNAEFHDLTPNTSYNVRVSAQTSAGYGPFTDDYIFTTLP